MKKVIALIVAAAIIITFLNISAFATSEPSSMTNKEYYAAQSNLIDKFCDGNITYSQFQEQSQAVTDEYITANTIGGVLQAGALNASNNIAAVSQKIGATVDKWGDGARERVKDWWNDVCNKKNVPTETTQTSIMDMHGYGACVVCNTVDPPIYRYCNYVIMDYYNTGDPYSTICYVGPYVEYKYNNITGNYEFGSVRNSGFNESSTFSVYYKYYGDIRYGNGEQFPTDDEFVYGTIKNFDDMSERDLEDLFNDLAETIELNSPDLSSIEGLLNAIYARLGTLDSDDDNGLLSQINTSIHSLNSSIADLSTSIETSINDLKETITSLFSNEDKKDDDNKTETEKHEIAGTLYNVIPLEKSWLKKFSDEIFNNKANLKVEYEGKVYYLEDDGTLKLDGKYYNVDMNYASDLDEILDTLFDIKTSLELLTEEEKQMSFDDFFDLKVNDFKLDLDEKFAFKDNLKDFIQNFFDEFNSYVPFYESGG